MRTTVFWSNANERKRTLIKHNGPPPSAFKLSGGEHRCRVCLKMLVPPQLEAGADRGGAENVGLSEWLSLVAGTGFGVMSLPLSFKNQVCAACTVQQDNLNGLHDIALEASISTSDLTRIHAVSGMGIVQQMNMICRVCLDMLPPNKLRVSIYNPYVIRWLHKCSGVRPIAKYEPLLPTVICIGCLFVMQFSDMLRHSGGQAPIDDANNKMTESDDHYLILDVMDRELASLKSPSDDCSPPIQTEARRGTWSGRKTAGPTIAGAAELKMKAIAANVHAGGTAIDVTSTNLTTAREQNDLVVVKIIKESEAVNAVGGAELAAPNTDNTAAAIVRPSATRIPVKTFGPKGRGFKEHNAPVVVVLLQDIASDDIMEEIVSDDTYRLPDISDPDAIAKIKRSIENRPGYGSLDQKYYSLADPRSCMKPVPETNVAPGLQPSIGNRTADDHPYAFAPDSTVEDPMEQTNAPIASPFETEMEHSLSSEGPNPAWGCDFELAILDHIGVNHDDIDFDMELFDRMQSPDAERDISSPENPPVSNDKDKKEVKKKKVHMDHTYSKKL